MRPQHLFVIASAILTTGLVVSSGARPQPGAPPPGAAAPVSYENTTIGALAPRQGPDAAAADVARERTRILARPPPNHHRGASGSIDEDQDIIFPDSLEASEESMGHLDGPPRCANGATFCEDIDSYPYGRLKEVLRRTKSHNDLFGLDETPDEIANRIGEPEDIFICPAVDKIIYPKVGKTKYNEWKYIINQGDAEGYVQGVRVETCKALNRPCDVIGHLPDGITTSCKQKYVYRRMLSVSQVGQPLVDTFLMPSACCCSYTKDLQFLRRFGQRTSQKKRRR